MIEEPEDLEKNEFNDEYALIKIASKYYLLKIKSNSINEKIVTITLEDNTKLTVSLENIIIMNKESEIINEILENSNETYTTYKGNYEKPLVKKLSKDNPFKLIKGNKNE